jgi:manganese efflux pump family protein
MTFLKLLFIAICLGLDVFSLSIAIGIRDDLNKLQKIRIGLSFATAEMSMIIIGALLGEAIGSFIGDVAGYIGFIAIVFLGIYIIIEYYKNIDTEEALEISTPIGLFLTSLSISIDSLGIGFSIFYIGIPFFISVITIGIMSILSTTSGLLLGKYLGHKIGTKAELIGGILLIITGLAFIISKLLKLE